MNPEKQCQICSKPSNGMHFGAMTCRACAAFFRRAVVLKLEYSCKNNKICDLEQSGRSICRYCRFEKCKEIGMDAEKVVLDYDPTTSQKVPTMTIPTEVQSTPLQKMLPKLAEKLKMKIDFTELVEQIHEIFETLGKADMKAVLVWLNVRIRRYATWFSHATYLMKNLPEDQKMQLYKTSWNVVRLFERMSMTLNVFGQEMLDENFLLVSDCTKMLVDRSFVNFGDMTEFTDDYFNRLFHPFLNKYIDEVARPMFDLNLTTEEVVFCMVNILGFDVTGLSDETIETLHRFKEMISDQMHFYYLNSTNLRMYSHRIMQLMKLVKTITSIAREKTKIKELIWIFDVYKAEISDPYFFQLF